MDLTIREGINIPIDNCADRVACVFLHPVFSQKKEVKRTDTVLVRCIKGWRSEPLWRAEG